MPNLAPLTGRSHRLVIVLVLLILLPAAVVGGLGVQYVVQDRAFEVARQREVRDSVANRVVGHLRGLIAESERALETWPPRPEADAVFMAITDAGVEVQPSTRLLFVARTWSAVDPPPTEFQDGERLEFRLSDFPGAEAQYRRLWNDASPTVRGGALIRSARVFRHQRRFSEALQAYDALKGLTIRIDGVPADLVARRSRCMVFSEMKDVNRLRTEAEQLRAGLLAGTWEIDRGTFEHYLAKTAEWTGTDTFPSARERAVAEAAEWLWERRGTAGREVVRADGMALAVLWRSTERGAVALIAEPAFQRRAWFSRMTPPDAGREIRVALALGESAAYGSLPGVTEANVVRHTSNETDLPWDVVVSTGDIPSGGVTRRRLMLAALGVFALLVTAGAYVIARAVSRDLELARLQSEFVASVSHEFRTPLTSLRQFADLLNESDEDLPAEKRQRFRAAQNRAIDRLQRLVESLLDFQRMDSGAHAFDRRLLPADTFVRSVINDFEPDAAARGFTIDYRNSTDPISIHGDPESLALALRNLLDNAVKYSGDSRTVEVALSRRDGFAAISVRDAGIGVPPGERRDIFRKFVRGRDPRVRRVKGTGIGLAMVQHIIGRHAGRVLLESGLERGSTFTVLLPLDGQTG